MGVIGYMLIFLSFEEVEALVGFYFSCIVCVVESSQVVDDIYTKELENILNGCTNGLVQKVVDIVISLLFLKYSSCCD